MVIIRDCCVYSLFQVATEIIHTAFLLTFTYIIYAVLIVLLKFHANSPLPQLIFKGHADLHRYFHFLLKLDGATLTGGKEM